MASQLGRVGGSLATGMAGAIAGAAARSLINGTDFGDNILATLPDVIGNTIGNLVADGVTSMGRNAHAASLLKEIAPNGATPEQRQHVKDMLNVGVSDADITSFYAQGLDKVPALASGGSGPTGDIVVYARRKPQQFDLSGLKFGSNGSEKLPISGSIRLPSLHVKGNELYGTVRVNVENFGGNPDIKYMGLT